MPSHNYTRRTQVHCHVGSLEKTLLMRMKHELVHCHVGSLENNEKDKSLIKFVHCHVGSLEMQVKLSHQLV